MADELEEAASGIVRDVRQKQVERAEKVTAGSVIGFWTGGIAGYVLGRRIQHPVWGTILGMLGGAGIVGSIVVLATKPPATPPVDGAT